MPDLNARGGVGGSGGSVLSVSVFRRLRLLAIFRRTAWRCWSRPAAMPTWRRARRTALAGLAWADHLRYRPRLTSLQGRDGDRGRGRAGSDPAGAHLRRRGGQPRRRRHGQHDRYPGRVPTRRGSRAVPWACFHDPALWPPRRTTGAKAPASTSVFNRTGPHPMSERFEAEAGGWETPARRRLRRVAAGSTPAAGWRWGRRPSLRLGGIRVVVSSLRMQSRRSSVLLRWSGSTCPPSGRWWSKLARLISAAGFDEVFGPDQVVEVDGPGLSLAGAVALRLPRPAAPGVSARPERVDWTPPPPPPRLSGHAGQAPMPRGAAEDAPRPTADAGASTGFRPGCGPTAPVSMTAAVAGRGVRLRPHPVKTAKVDRTWRGWRWKGTSAGSPSRR